MKPNETFDVLYVLFGLYLFDSSTQASMESDKLSERQYLLERLLEAVKQVTEYYFYNTTVTGYVIDCFLMKIRTTAIFKVTFEAIF